MKSLKYFLATLMVASMAMFTACDHVNEPDSPGKAGQDPVDSTEVKEDTIAQNATVASTAQVTEIANNLAAGTSTTEYYKVEGIVSAVATASSSLVSYGNCNFTLQDSTGVIGCYYINYLGNQKFTSVDQIPVVGDTVVVVSQLKSYSKTDGTTTPEMANGYIYSIKRYQSKGNDIIDITLAQADSIRQTLATGASTVEKYRVQGTVSDVQTAADKLLGYGNCNFKIQDDDKSHTLSCWYTYWLNNTNFTSTDDIPVVGDKVVVVGTIQNYQGNTTEIYKGYIESIIRK